MKENGKWWLFWVRHKMTRECEETMKNLCVSGWVEWKWRKSIGNWQFCTLLVLVLLCAGFDDDLFQCATIMRCEKRTLCCVDIMRGLWHDKVVACSKVKWFISWSEREIEKKTTVISHFNGHFYFKSKLLTDGATIKQRDTSSNISSCKSKQPKLTDCNKKWHIRSNVWITST
jgi:hypothetical protein